MALAPTYRQNSSEYPIVRAGLVMGLGREHHGTLLIVGRLIGRVDTRLFGLGLGITDGHSMDDRLTPDVSQRPIVARG